MDLSDVTLEGVLQDQQIRINEQTIQMNDQQMQLNREEFILNLLNPVLQIALLISILWLGLGCLKPIGKRLGTGLRSRKITIIADDTENGGDTYYKRIRKIVASSGIFKERNIEWLNPKTLYDREQGVDAPDLCVRNCLKGKTLLIFDYVPDAASQNEASNAQLNKILDNKERRAGLIVHAPPPPNGIKPGDMMTKASDAPNTVVVNAYGRLLNDLWNLMVTTDFQESAGQKGMLSAILDRIKLD